MLSSLWCSSRRPTPPDTPFFHNHSGFLTLPLPEKRLARKYNAPGMTSLLAKARPLTPSSLTGWPEAYSSDGMLSKSSTSFSLLVSFLQHFVKSLDLLFVTKLSQLDLHQSTGPSSCHSSCPLLVVAVFFLRVGRHQLLLAPSSLLSVLASNSSKKLFGLHSLGRSCVL